MEVPSLDHNITSPMSPCEDMVNNLSLESLELCERDGRTFLHGFISFSIIDKLYIYMYFPQKA